MARSKHTRPPAVLAASRVRAPYEPRRAGDASARYALARALKDLGIVAPPAEPSPDRGPSEPAPLPRLRATRPRAGYSHPASKADIASVLRFFGERCSYGLRSIELVRGDRAPAGERLLLGALLVPGRIVLYDQPPSPWLLPGRLAGGEQEMLRRAGASVELVGGGSQTVVSWPGATLRDFMLFDVLMHEVGHHLIQQYKGKRRARVARTRDHEAFTDGFARRCRRLYRGGGQAGSR